jgi:hypothetical protein
MAKVIKMTLEYPGKSLVIYSWIVLENVLNLGVGTQMCIFVVEVDYLNNASLCLFQNMLPGLADDPTKHTKWN